MLVFRYHEYEKIRKAISDCEGGLEKFSLSFKSFGIHIKEDNSVYCKEWAPRAHQLFLYGEFSKLYLVSFRIIF